MLLLYYIVCTMHFENYTAVISQHLLAFLFFSCFIGNFRDFLVKKKQSLFNFGIDGSFSNTQKLQLLVTNTKNYYSSTQQ